jgi:phage terminase large subunit GpA-like protein
MFNFDASKIKIEQDYTFDLCSFEKELRQAFKPPTKYTISKWADEHRFLSTSTSAYSGRWRTDRVPYMKFIMDCITNPRVEQVTLMMCSQVGKTELLLNIMGYYIDNDPCPIMFVMPTKDLVEQFSKRSFATMIRESDCFKNKIQIDKKSSSNNVDYKEFSGGLVLFVGSQKANALASVPIRIVLADEIDRFAREADKEGNPINLAKKRTANFTNRKWILCSTPTEDETSQIKKEYENSSAHKYYVPCVHCGYKQYLKWQNVQWQNHDPKTAKYMCEECGVLWDDRDRWRAIGNGEWIAENHDNIRNLGFHLPRFASGFCKLSDVVQEFLDAKKDRLKLKVFVNTVLAETWKDSTAETAPETIMNMAEDYDFDKLPTEIMFITAGVDIQKDRIECMIVGWGDDFQAWVIDYVVLYGDPLQDAVWGELDTLLAKNYYSEEFEQELSVKICAIDSGYIPQRVYNFAYKYYYSETEYKKSDCVFFATKGQDIVSSKGRHPLHDKRQVGNADKFRNDMKPFSCGTYEAKSMLYEFFNYDSVRKNYWHFPKKLTIDFYEQLTAEKKYLEYKNGKEYYKWECPAGKRNEALDTAVLNLWCIHASDINFAEYREYLESQKVKKEIKPINFPKLKPRNK